MTLTIQQITLDNILKINKIDLDDIEKAAALCFSRMQRFIEGYYCDEEITTLYKEFLGNTNVNQMEGLMPQYHKLRELIISENKMGLILYGMNVKDILIDTYPTTNGTIIELTVEGISRILLKSYFSQEEIHNLCRTTHNFNTYYQNV